MILNDPASSPELSYKCAVMVGMLRNASAETQIRAFANTIRPGVITTRFFPATSQCPTFMLVAWNDTLLVLVDGITTFSQAAFYLAGVDRPNDWNNEAGLNPALIINRNVIFMAISVLGATSSPRIVIAGHSMGGAISQALWLRFRADGQANAVSVITYGSPKIGPYTAAYLMQACDLQRWMTTLDPVPHIPPTVAEAPIFALTLTAGGRGNMMTYSQAHGGTIIDADGSIHSADVTSTLQPTIQVSLAAWIVSIALNQSSEHAMPTYVARLLILSDVAPPVSVARNHTTQPQVQSKMSRTEINRVVENALDVIRQGQHDVSASDLRLPGSEIFSAAKVAGVWVVQFRDQSITVAPTRRRARKLATLGNRFLRALQIQGKVDVESFVSSFTQYLTDATDPDSGFHPTMQT